MTAVVRRVPGGDVSLSWWRGWRVAVAIAAAMAVAAAAFAYRFNTLGGTLGGLDNDHFAHLMRSQVLLEGEQPLRDFADAELRGAWPALGYAVSAWAQRVGGRTLLPEAILTVGALALSHAIVFLLALDLSRRWSVAMVAAALAIATGPKLYNYPKVTMLAFGALAIRAAMSSPSVLRLGLAAIVTAAAVLFRHDYGVYVAAGMIGGLVARDMGAWRNMLRSVGIYAGLTTVCLLPSALWVQAYEGIPTYVRTALASTGLETARTELRLPAFDYSSPFVGEGPVVLSYYAFWAVLLVSGGVLALRTIGAGTASLAPAARGTAAGLLAMAALVNVFFLRANLSQRFGDAVVPIVLLAAWSVGAASVLHPRPMRGAAVFVPAALLISMFGAAWVYGDVASNLDSSGLSDSWEKTARRFDSAAADLSRLPPTTWRDEDAEGTLVAARYVAECTSPGDRLLVAAYAPEVPVFARRGFAAGQPTVSLSFYTSEQDQRRALARLERQSVPIVLVDGRDFEEAFVSDYPLLAEHVTRHYRKAGTIVVDEEPRFLVFVEAGRQPHGVDPHLGLPCFQ